MNTRELEYLRSPAAMTAAKAILLGLAVGELWFACHHVLSVLTLRFEGGTERCFLIVEVAALAAVTVTCVFRHWLHDIRKVACSLRLDLLASFLFGILVSSLFPFPDYIPFNGYLVLLTDIQLVALFGLFIFVPFVHVLRSVVLGNLKVPAKLTPFFLNDDERVAPEDDLLGFRESSERFARRVLNGGSAESIVFGLDAPWGTGKSTFVNFCVDRWNKSTEQKAMVFRFNPLQYEDRKNLLQKFIDGLILTIREREFIPELQTIVSRYSKLVSNQQTISIAGINVELTKPNLTIDQAAADIGFALSKLKHRLIIIVDDLDRIDFSEVRDILFVIKKGFALPNVSVLLCYDTQNIGAMEDGSPGSEKISEFLEKFVNVKVGLFLSSSDLERYLTANLAATARGNLLTDFRLLDDALGGLRDIYKSADYHHYAPFVGNVRKVKRLINTLVLLNIDQINLKLSDYDVRDLIRLLMIYVNYPTLFRKIYDAETEGRCGFFSAEDKYANNGWTFANSADYSTFVKDLQTNGRMNETFLLNSIFEIGTRLKSAESSSVPDDARHTYACFNHRGQRNLENYLNLIVRVSNPPNRGHYRFYVSAKDRFVSGEPLEKILAAAEFAYSSSETSHQEFWRVVVNSAPGFDPARAAQAINYVVDTMDKHSMLEDADLGIGLRYSSRQYTLLKLLDTVGWQDDQGLRRNNSPEHLVEIADWIFGTGKHVGRGILDRLLAPARGVFGLMDAMLFRLYCCMDRSGNLFNLNRALITHSDAAAPTTGVVRELLVVEMREISQSIFRMFKNEYINNERNIFEEIENLSLADLAGAFVQHVNKSIEHGNAKSIHVTRLVLSTKATMKSFIVYQLTNKLINSGIGCGFYDEAGKNDGGGIFHAMNAYLFRCFGPDVEAKGFEHFLDYMLTQLRSNFRSHTENAWQVDIDSVCLVLDRQLLREYWATYRVAFDALHFENMEKDVITPNYAASYKKDLTTLYAELDKLVAEQAAGTPIGA